MLIYWLGGQFDAETFEGLNINLRQHDGGVNLAAAQFFELFQGDLCVFVGSGAHGQRDQNFIGVETRVAASEVLDFQLLDRLDRDRGDHWPTKPPAGSPGVSLGSTHWLSPGDITG